MCMRYLLVVLLLYGFTGKEVEFTGNNVIEVLDKGVSSSWMQQFSNYWLLNENLSNPEGGIRLILDNSSQKIDTVLFSGYGYHYNGVEYYTCSSILPFGIRMTDNVEAIKNTINGTVQKVDDTFLFRSSHIGVRVQYLSYGKIQQMEVFKMAEPVNTVPERSLTAALITENLEKVDAVVKSKASISAGDVALKKALMEVFRSWRETSLASIQTGERKATNFWNYKYTYSTTVKIPGEEFNMIYRFPFIYSQLDFVSVLKEADHYDSSFETVYKNFEKRLMATFTKNEGWYASCLPNTDGSKLSDLEFRNKDLGSIILDYSRSPSGGHVLYLRFLLYSN